MATNRLLEIPIARLRPHPRNARTHTKEQIAKLADAIRTFGFNSPILIDATNQIICGQARVEAAKLLGMSLVQAIRIEHLSDAQIRAFIIADNKLAELAGWDIEILGQELQFLMDVDIDATVSEPVSARFPC